MPQRIVCGGCGLVLYEGIELESPVETVMRYGGHCPKCRKKLEYSPDNVLMGINPDNLEPLVNHPEKKSR